MNYLIPLAVLLLLTGQARAAGADNATSSLRFKMFLKSARALSPEARLQRLETEAKISENRSYFGNVTPEFGLEGGGRSSRERENKNNSFYYGYIRYELSLKEIFELKAALNRKEASELERDQIELHLDYVMASKFFEVFLLQESLRLKREDLALTETQIATAKRRVDGGLATDTDLLEFQMHQQERQNEVTQLDVELQYQKRELERISGIQTITSLSSETLDTHGPMTFEAIWQNVQRANLDLRSMRAESKVAQAEKWASAGGWLPRLSVEGQYGKLLETDFMESKRSSWEVVGKMTLPLFTGFSTRNDYQSKSYQAERASLKELQAEQKLRSQTVDAMARVEASAKRLEGERKNTETAERYYRAIAGEYKRGVKNSPDMAGATDKLFEARLKAMEAERDYNLAILNLARLQGLSLDL